ncbi:MAG: serine acetyltransferase [Bdellovibrio sp.]|nr:serine acetyltransferase [Methylotenera sp.]
MNTTNFENAEVSNSVPDWSREHKSFFTWDPSRSLLASIRAYQYYASSNSLLVRLPRKIAVFRHLFWSVITAADIPINCKIGGGLLIPHPNGIVIHPDVTIGVNCLIFQQVTLGSVSECTTPAIGGHVDIGAGAKVLGGIQIGNDVKIGANAVVLIDVPDGNTAVGVPARIISH